MRVSMERHLFEGIQATQAIAQVYDISMISRHILIFVTVSQTVSTGIFTSTNFKENEKTYLSQDNSAVLLSLKNIPSLCSCATFCANENCVAYIYDISDQTCKTYSDIKCDKTKDFSVSNIKLHIKDKDTAKVQQVKPSAGSGDKYTECLDAPGVGVYTIWPKPTYSVMAYCDYGGWTVFLRRLNGSVSFDRKWSAYKNGFGNAAAEYWLGNEAVHYITSNGPHELKVELEAFDCRNKYAKYSSFSIANEADKYRLSVSGYSGTAGDSLDYPVAKWNNNGKQFATKDVAPLCSDYYHGGWWFSRCTTAFLTGVYTTNPSKYHGENIFWYTFEGATLMPIFRAQMATRKKVPCK